MTTTSAGKVSKGERTRERILSSALTLFSEKGFATTSVRDIAAHAGITHAGLLHHFPSKDEMLVRVLAYREQQEHTRRGQLESASAEQLFHWLIEIVEQNIADPARMRLFAKISAEATDPDHPARAYFTARYATLVAEFERVLTDRFTTTPPLITITPREAAESILALSDGLQMQWLLGEDLDMSAILRRHIRALGINI